MWGIRSIHPVIRAGAIAIASFSATPAIANPDSAQGTAQVSIVDPLKITNTADLDFGRIIAPISGTARVRINARTGARTSNVNATPIGTDFGRGTFVVTGESRTRVDLSMSSPTIQLTGPGAPMTVDRIRVSRNSGGQRSLPRSYNIPASGTMEIGVGGRLRFPAGQTPGVYTGSFVLTVSYQ